MAPPLLSWSAVTRTMSSFILSVCVLLFLCANAAPVRAFPAIDPQDPPAATPSHAAASSSASPEAAAPDPADEDDDAVLRPLEPDFTLINLPTTLPLPVHKSNFRLTHRFNGDLRRGNFGDQLSSLFGMDDGATMGFEYRFAVVKHVEAAAYRTNFDRTIQLYGKYDAFHQNAKVPLGFSAIVSVEGTNNFRQQYRRRLVHRFRATWRTSCRSTRCRCGYTTRRPAPA